MSTQQSTSGRFFPRAYSPSCRKFMAPVTVQVCCGFHLEEWASNPVRNWLVTPMMLLPPSHQWPYHTRLVVTVACSVHNSVKRCIALSSTIKATLSRDLCGSGCETGTSEGIDLSQDLCRSGNTQVWELRGSRSEPETFVGPTPSQGFLHERI